MINHRYILRIFEIFNKYFVTINQLFSINIYGTKCGYNPKTEFKKLALSTISLIFFLDYLLISKFILFNSDIRLVLTNDEKEKHNEVKTKHETIQIIY